MLRKELTNKGMLFLVIHKNGVLVYSYPFFSEEHILVSSLVSAIHALIDNIISEKNDRLELRFGSYNMVCEAEGDLIYCFVVDEEKCYHSVSILRGLKEIVEHDFPAEIRDNVVKVDEYKARTIDVAIDLFLDTLKTHVLDLNIEGSKSLYRMWMSTMSLNIHIIKKIHQAVLEGKSIFLFHKDLGVAYEFAEMISCTGFKPVKIKIIKPEDIDDVDLTDQAIYIAKDKPQGRISSILESSSIFIDLDSTDRN